MTEVIVIELDDFMNGRLSVECDDENDISELCNIITPYGVNTENIMMVTAKHIGVRCDHTRFGFRTCYSLTGGDWHVRNGFTSRWVPLRDFAEAIYGSRDPVEITSVDDLI